MRNMHFRLLAIIIFALAYVQVSAQPIIGYFESDKVLAHIPEYAGIQQQLNVLSEGWKEEINRLEEEIQAMQEDFEAKEILYTEEIRRQRQQEIAQKITQKDNLIAQRFGPQGQYFTRQQELLEPIQRQVFAALKAVAERKRLDFVFDRSGDIYMVYANAEWDITNDILLELGIEIDDN